APRALAAAAPAVDPAATFLALATALIDDWSGSTHQQQIADIFQRLYGFKFADGLTSDNLQILGDPKFGILFGEPGSPGTDPITGASDTQGVIASYDDMVEFQQQFNALSPDLQKSISARILVPNWGINLLDGQIDLADAQNFTNPNGNPLFKAGGALE